MSSSRRDRLPTGALVSLAVLGLVLGLVAPVALAGTTIKPALVTGIPAQVAPGSFTATVTITNEAPQQQLGSANLTPPSGFTIQGAAASAGTSTISSNTLQLRNLSLPPGGSVTVALQMMAPCVAPTDPSWSIRIKQSNNFNGPPGNDFVLDPASTTSTTLSGSGCVLVFSREPASAQTGASITSVAFDPSGASVEVQVQDGLGHLVDSSASITIGIGVNPGGGTLSGTTTSSAVGGIADFTSISIDQPGLGYTLAASSPGVTGAESTAFDIADVVVPCTTGSTCTGAESNPTTSVSVTASSGQSDGVLTISLLGNSDFQCAGYIAYSTPTEFNVTAGDRFKTVTIRLDKRVVNQIPDNGAAHFQVCYVSPNAYTTDGSGNPVSFFDRNGDPIYPNQPGLLPDCNNTSSNPPCVLSRNKDKAGDVIVTFLAPIGDPKGRI
jgi:hypothetical protein